MVKTIVIDAGAVGNGLKEKDLTLSIALATVSYFKKYYTDHRIVMSDDTQNGYVPYIKAANRYR